MTTFSRTYPSHPKSIGAARRALDAFLKECGCSSSDRFDINVAVAEAVANAIEHGHVPGGSVSLDCSYDGDVTVTVRDEGGGMRAKTWQRVFIKATVGGFGLMLMRGLMDDVKVDINEDYGATVVMHKRCAWQPSSAFAHRAR